jgi:hypothetical protein
MLFEDDDFQDTHGYISPMGGVRSNKEPLPLPINLNANMMQRY